jgi:prolyl oligopeptidase
VSDDDEYRWLEDLDDAAATAWVHARNDETTAALAGSARFAELKAEIREVLDSAQRLPYPTWRGDYLYNHWKDEAHPRGLWRRTTVDLYRTAEPEWDVLLDLDALAEAEGENWVWQGAFGLRPAYQRYLILLSRGGADAGVVREFDLATREFVAAGFTLPEAKSDVGWVDVDHIHVGTDFGAGSLTASGYPRVVKRWRRGTPLAEAEVVFEGQPDDVVAYAEFDQTPGFARTLVGRRMDFFRQEISVRSEDGGLTRIGVPEDAVVDIHREWLLIRPRSRWTVGAVTYAAGTVVVTPLADFLAGERALTTVFQPDPHTAFAGHVWAGRRLIIGALSDVSSRLTVWTPGPDGWASAPLAGRPGFGHSAVVDAHEETDEVLLLSTGFLEPTSFWYGQLDEGAAPIAEVKREPAFFDPAGMAVRQFFATSDDGTRVPYFVVGEPDAHNAPTLLSGYGGFEVARVPYYDGTLGRAWLARGGVSVLANIRGGGEYGPDWHTAALRENRPRAFEDFAAVAADLVRRGITTPARLGTEGGSNGGLLMGVMLTRYPELFGAVVAHVPLLDMRRYHLLLAGASWVAEYGDPDVESDWAFLREYSPYQNVRSGQSYPSVLLTTSTRDDRVHPAHARKMTARLRELGYDVTYYENTEGGHGGAADNEQLAFQKALVYEFLWRRLAA